jgi:electron transfer flavoprotein alpha subunit
MIAVILVRDGALPAGFDEAICEADRRALLIGSNVAEALVDVRRFARVVWTCDIDSSRLAVSAVASVVAECLRIVWDGNAHPETESQLRAVDDGEAIVLPSSPDGRDLAPHLAYVLERGFHAGATRVSEGSVTVSRRGGLFLSDIHPQSPFVATLQIGIRGADPLSDSECSRTDIIEVARPPSTPASTSVRAVEHIEIQPPDASTMDLAEAPRILGGGAGLVDSHAFDQLQRIAGRLGASMGVTRVITDRGWAEHNRQIGTTGVVVDPDLYISFGISGAVQHTSGLGHPEHIISVNTDAHCPMMQISDVAIVADANEVLDALEILLFESGEAQ